MVHLRPATPADAAAWAEVTVAALPYFVTDEGAEAFDMAADPPGARRLVAERDGRVVGVGRFDELRGEDHSAVRVMVHPDHRGRGIGRALLDRLRAHAAVAGVDRVTVVVEEDAGSRAAAQRWGFTLVRELQMASLDPAGVVAPEPPAGVRVVPATAVGPRPVWELYAAVARDDPSGLTLPTPYDEWLAQEWANPRVRPELSRAVLVGEELACFTMLMTAGTRASSAMTGTAPAHRGRGLALLAKRHALAAAAAAGVTVAITGNDTSNAPMLAVNRRLGYRPLARPALAEWRR